MAYMNQEKKKTIATYLKMALKGTGIKYSLGVRHHSTIVMKITAGPVDFIKNYVDLAHLRPEKYDMVNGYPTYLDVNPYCYKEHFNGKALDILTKIFDTMNAGNHDRSDVQSDYFDVGWYVDVNVGTWDKPYEVTQ